jgi:hypothetical protein
MKKKILRTAEKLTFFVPISKKLISRKHILTEI